MVHSDESTQLQRLLDRFLEDDADISDELIDHAMSRLRALARRMLARYPHVRRWEETDDVMQAAVIRLHRSLREVRPENKRAFFGLAATQMRRTLIDLARHYYGTYGLGRNHRSAVQTEKDGGRSPNGALAKPDNLEGWTEFHEAIEQLPDSEREVLSLVWYGGLMQKEVAHVLNVSERTVIRRMNRARLALSELVGHSRPRVD